VPRVLSLTLDTIRRNAFIVLSYYSFLWAPDGSEYITLNHYTQNTSAAVKIKPTVLCEGYDSDGDATRGTMFHLRLLQDSRYNASTSVMYSVL